MICGPQARLEPMTIERRDLRPEDVAIKISYCGICHTDLHFAHDDWGMSQYPMVPGHEIVGTVTEVGSAVTRYKPDDRVGVGCLRGRIIGLSSCLSPGTSNSASKCPPFTYSAPDRQTGEITQGGYSQSIVVREEFVCRIPDELDFAHAAPLLCAGITTYSPLKRWGVKKGDKVAVAGLGGLGHMAVKLAKAMGAEVTVLTTSPEKGSAARENGASNVSQSRPTKKPCGRHRRCLQPPDQSYSRDPRVAALREPATTERNDGNIRSTRTASGTKRL